MEIFRLQRFSILPEEFGFIIVKVFGNFPYQAKIGGQKGNFWFSSQSLLYSS